MWSNDCQRSFDALQQALCEAPVLAYPRFDLPFMLDTGASTTGVKAVLSQAQDGGREAPNYIRCQGLDKIAEKVAINQD